MGVVALWCSYIDRLLDFVQRVHVGMRFPGSKVSGLIQRIL